LGDLLAGHWPWTTKALELWHANWPDDLLTTIPGIGPIAVSATRAWLGEGRHLESAKATAAFIGLNPSNWESGLSASASRSITKEGPPALRLAYYQAANIARRHDPGLAAHYRTLMIDRRHNHISANCAVARKLAARTWAVFQRGQPYVLRDCEGNPIDWLTASALAASLAVPLEARRRARATANQRGRLSG
jgi:transposase